MTKLNHIKPFDNLNEDAGDAGFFKAIANKIVRVADEEKTEVTTDFIIEFLDKEYGDDHTSAMLTVLIAELEKMGKLEEDY